jgi:serine/threonine protein kinase
MNHVDIDTSIQIEGYDVVSELAHGNYGVVYLGVQKRLNRLVAIKVLADDLNNDKNYIAQFHHEAQVAAQLSHPNVVQAFDVGHGISDHFYFVMELVDGEDIYKIIKRKGKISWRQSFEWMKDIAIALDYGMHKRQLTHGDIKPANVMITKAGKVKLADLGLACMGGEKKDEEQQFTPYYAAPEVIDGTWEIGDPRADMYSFGATLYHMVSGRPVFDSEDCDEILEMHQHKNAIDCNVFASVPDDVSDFICRLLEKHPEDRFSKWSEITDQIDHLLKQECKVITHSGSHLSRKIISSCEFRKKALKRLKKRKKRKVKVLQYYAYVGVGLAFLFVLVDLIISSVSGEGTLDMFLGLVRNLSGG